MAFTPSTARDIVRRLAIRITGKSIPLTDLTVISPLRMLLEAMAAEMATLHRGLAEAVDHWHIDTARDADLDRRLADFGLTRSGARRAYGTVTVTSEGPVNVPPGATFSTANGTSYTARTNATPDATAGDLADGSWHVDGSREIVVEAAAVGSGYTAANTITILGNGTAGLVSVVNTSPLTNGSGPASDAEFRQHFRNWLDALNGCSRGALLFDVLGYQDSLTGRRVRSAAVQEWDGAGLLNENGRNVAMIVYVDEGIGAAAAEAATAHSSLVAAVQRFIDGSDTQDRPGVRPAGSPVAVVAAKARLVDVSVHIDIDSKFGVGTITSRVRAAIETHLAALPVGGRLISGELQGQLILARLVNDVQDLEGVLDARFATPAANVAIPTGYKATAGQIVITSTVVNA